MISQTDVCWATDSVLCGRWRLLNDALMLVAFGPESGCEFLLCEIQVGILLPLLCVLCCPYEHRTYRQIVHYASALLFLE